MRLARLALLLVSLCAIGGTRDYQITYQITYKWPGGYEVKYAWFTWPDGKWPDGGRYAR